ncbi:Oidioi.mRNA.OKI2018_I69.PAR.g11082.t2.cds [Oikopleura dioica]|uniref:Oidioi.mRNA.OKI2018_I69.PAR.g11082.t2.cds n=1 Tax=Oikopleura dioica TaxID=34765 RepID=A0ABN7RX50_OIKDI|nr:Oidioi.mRNA.OKI2018_I69.PAR.g11082.t2.cds [Oikopleura dioica]
MWRPSGNRGGNRGRGSPGRGGSQSASPWPDSNNGRQGRRGYGENQNNQFQQKSKSDDPRNHVGMSFRGSGRPVTRPEAPGPNANLSSGGLVRPPGPARPGGMPQLRGRGQGPRFGSVPRQPQQLNTIYRYPSEPGRNPRGRNAMDPNFQASWYQGKESQEEDAHGGSFHQSNNHFYGPYHANNSFNQNNQQNKYDFNPHQGPVSFRKDQPAPPPEPSFAPPSEPPPPPIPEFVEWELRHLQGPLGEKMRKYASLVSFRKSSEESQRRMWNIELDRHREIMRAEAQAEARLIEQERQANMPKKQAGGYATISDSDRLKNIDWNDLKLLTDKDLNLKLDEMKNLQEKSKKEYFDWKEDCEKWKNQHANHPNKTLFQNYIDQWKEQDKTLMKVQEDQAKKIELIRDELYRRDPGPPSPPKFFDLKGGDDFPANLMKKGTINLAREDVVSHKGRTFERPPAGYGMPRCFSKQKMVEPKRLSDETGPPVYEPPKEPGSLKLQGMDDIPDLPSRKRKPIQADVTSSTCNLLDLDVNNLKDLLSKVQQNVPPKEAEPPQAENAEDPENPSGLPDDYQLPVPMPEGLPSAIPPVRVVQKPVPPPVIVAPNAPPVLHHQPRLRHPRPPMVHQRPPRHNNPRYNHPRPPFHQKQYRPRLTQEEKSLYERAELARSIPPKQEKKLDLGDKGTGVQDLVLLENINEEAVLENLRKRFAKNAIYTYIGPVVISINPYQNVAIYSDDIVRKYNGRNMYEMPAHLFGLVEAAYRQMRTFCKDQCILITGESGAGKTEASKIMMNYISTCAEERNFHIFYFLIHGIDEAELASFQLTRRAVDYNILARGGVEHVPGINDSKRWEELVSAMVTIGFAEEEIGAIKRIIAAILHLGNVQFTSKGDDECQVKNAEVLGRVATLLRIHEESLSEALTRRAIKISSAKGETVHVTLSVPEAEAVQLSFCKALYGRVFDWLVQRLNAFLKIEKKEIRSVIGVLDIYGFEVLTENSFEQLLINYCNEKLHQVFIELTLKQEQEEYQREGIQWQQIEYFNNVPIVNLIEGRPGVLGLLDEECLRPGETGDAQLLQKFDIYLQSSKFYQSRENNNNSKSNKATSKNSNKSAILSSTDFSITHYAGTVKYSIINFVEKNKDVLYSSLSAVSFNSSCHVLKQCFPEGDPKFDNRKRPPTQGHQFKLSMSTLMKNLLQKQPHYIRCIKPNEQKAPKLFDKGLVTSQIRYLGLVENVRVRRAGYSFRQSYPEFHNRYKMMSDSTWPSSNKAHRDAVKCILEDTKLSKDEYEFGRSKIFIRSPKMIFKLEEIRLKMLESIVAKVQAQWRCYVQRKKFTAMKSAQISISSQWKCYKQRRLYLETKKSTLTIQCFFRGMRARAELARLKLIQKRHNAATTIAAAWRGMKCRRETRKLFKANAAPIIARFMDNLSVKKYLLALAKSLPSSSPTDSSWPILRHKKLAETDSLLRKLHHKWRCTNHIRKLTPSQHRLLVDKVECAEIADYINLNSEKKWEDLSTKNLFGDILFADIMQKVNRKDGKTQEVIVVLTSAVSILAADSLKLKSTIEVKNIHSICMSPYDDGVCTLRVKQDGLKGDLLLTGRFVLEFALRLGQIKRKEGKELDIIIQPNWKILYKQHELSIAVSESSSVDLPSYKKKNNHIEIHVPKQVKT